MSMSPTSVVRVLGIAGSLRAASYNRAALRAAQALAPEGMTIEIFDLAPLPMYDGDLEAKGVPAPVAELWAKMAASHAVLFVTPEYNFSMSGPTKNCVDWISRDPAKAFLGKPAAIMGASRGVTGTARAQYHLRQSMVLLDMHPVNKPEVFIGAAHTKFDAQGNLTDQPTRDFIGQLLAALRDWTRKIGG